MFLNRIILTFLLLLAAAGANAFLGFGAARAKDKTLEEARAAYQRADYALTVDILDDFLLKDIPKKQLKEAYLLIGGAYQMQGAYDKAMLKYAEAIEFFPNDIELNLALGDIYYYGALTEKAALAYQKVLTLDAKNLPARLALARAYLADGFFTRSSKYFGEYLQMSGGGDADVYYDYALSFFMANNNDDAFEQALRANTLRPSARAQLLIAKIYKAKGQEARAFETIKEAAARPEAGDDVRLTRALWLAYDGGQKEAVEMAELYLKKNPEDRLALFIKYFALRRLGRQNEARQYLQKIAAREENGFIENIARTLLKNEKPEPKTKPQI